MKDKEREIRQRLKTKRDEAQRFLDGNQIEEARTAAQEAEAINEELQVYLRISAIEPGDTAAVIPSVAVPAGESRSGEIEDDPAYRSAFMKSLRRKNLTGEEVSLLESRSAEFRAMSGLTDADGGLVIPKDISTKIEMFKRQFVALEQYVTVEPVTTRSGSRVLEQNADITPFAEITELSNINEIESPKFTPLSYAIKDYGGILPLSNSLLQDSDQNLINYVSMWIAKKSVVTRNKLILDKVATLTKKTINDLDDIKNVLNVDLDPSISLNAIVLTNQDGYNYLDKQKDADGNYLLQTDPTQPTRKLLFGKPLIPVSNRFLKTVAATQTDGAKAPLIIGDLKEAIVMFDRQTYELKSTQEGGNSFVRNTTDVRVIEREDVKIWDSEAAIYGELIISGPSV